MKMPFGKYKNQEMDDLPATYLDWLRTIDLSRYPFVSEYLEENKMSIDSELRDA